MMLMGLAGAQLESRNGAFNGRQAVRAAHPELLPILLREARSEDVNVRLAAYAGIAWLYDAYQCKRDSLLPFNSYNFSQIPLPMPSLVAH
jgi:hypothetical protein